MAGRRINATPLTDEWFRENFIKSSDGWIVSFIRAERTGNHAFYRNNPKGLRRSFADHLTRLMWYELDQLRTSLLLDDEAHLPVYFTPTAYCGRFPQGEIVGPLRFKIGRSVYNSWAD